MPSSYTSLYFNIFVCITLSAFSSPSGSGHKEQSCYYYQIFMDYNHHLVLPTVQQLLEHSFFSNSLKLAEVSFVSLHVLCLIFCFQFFILSYFAWTFNAWPADGTVSLCVNISGVTQMDRQLVCVFLDI